MAANEGTNGHTEVPSDLEKKIIKQIEVSCRLFLFLLICFSARNPICGATVHVHVHVSHINFKNFVKGILPKVKRTLFLYS